eukprot:1457210-Amphidinium_carterae.1
MTRRSSPLQSWTTNNLLNRTVKTMMHVQQERNLVYENGSVTALGSYPSSQPDSREHLVLSSEALQSPII